MAVHSVFAAVIGSNSNARQQEHEQQPQQPSSSPTPRGFMFPPTDPDDPTDQPWAGKRSAPTSPKVPDNPRRSSAHAPDHLMTRSTIKASLEAAKGPVDADPTKKKKNLLDLIALTVSMAGAQVAWTLELGSVLVRPLSSIPT